MPHSLTPTLLQSVSLFPTLYRYTHHRSIFALQGSLECKTKAWPSPPPFPPQGDACALPADLPQFDAVLAANLVCRLPDPALFLARLPALVKPGGVAIIVSPHSWLPAWTPKSKWVGGFSQDGKPVYTASAMSEVLSKDFELVAKEDMPFLIREHARKYQWGCSNAMVWRRKGAK